MLFRSERVVTMPSSDIKWAQWLRVARNFQLRLGLKDKGDAEERRERRRETFDGFMREDHDRLTSLFKQHFGVALETVEVTFKGWNWGETDFRGDDLVFMHSNRVAFELPLSQVGNSNIARTEVSLEFNPPSSGKKSSKGGAVDEMMEIRFHVPGTQSRPRTGSDAGSVKSDAEEEEEASAAQVFHDNIKDRAAIGQDASDTILSFEEVLVLTPRGRYDVEMSAEYLRLRGRTYDYKIAYASISRLFLLPKDELHVLFILGLSNPIRQGQTRYQYLVMQFAREEETSALVNMPDEEIARYDRLQKNYEDPTFEVVSSVFRALSKKKIIGAGTFTSHSGLPGVKANLKAVQGDLFLLEKYVFFVSKQPTLVELSDIHQVVFSRVGVNLGASSARTFDLKFVTKSGPEYTFSSLNKEEHQPIESYFRDKKVKIKNEMVPDVDRIMAEVGDDDDDDDMASVDSDGPRRPAMGDEDDSEEDADFQASSTDEGSPSDSDDSSSGAETASDASGDRQIAAVSKKKKGTKKKAKEGGAAKDGAAPKKKKAHGDANQSDAEDDAAGDESASAPRPKPKPKAKKKDDGDAMDVDETSKPRPKPKAKAKPKSTKEVGSDMDVVEVAEANDEPPKKKKKVSP